MPNPQRSRAARAALAAVVLAAAVAVESSVDQALAQADAHHARHGNHGAGHRGQSHHAAAVKPVATGLVVTGPASAEPAHEEPPAPMSGAGFTTVPDRAVALGLPARIGADRTTIDVGYRDARVQMTLFEDYRCSSTAKFEASQGPMLRSLMARHQLLVHYVIESSLDERLPGPGAVAAADAARAAVAHGGFPLFHALLLANQGPEGVDGFTTDRLLALADLVPGLRSADFDAEVRTLYWKPWIGAAQHSYDTAGVHHGTPSMLLGGREVDLWAHPELLDDPAALQSFVENAANRGE